MVSVLFLSLGSSRARILTVAGANDWAGVTVNFSGSPPSTGNTVNTITPQIPSAVFMSESFSALKEATRGPHGAAAIGAKRALGSRPLHTHTQSWSPNA